MSLYADIVDRDRVISFSGPATATSKTISFRSSQAGPEQDLVDKFLGLFKIPVARGGRVTVFREPRLSSGFPDLVIVVWSESIAVQRAKPDVALVASDLRLLHHLATAHEADHPALAKLLGARVRRSLERLESAGLVRLRRGLWRARPLSKVFAVRDIIAVEAKVAGWRQAVRQAWINTWFASESYVLVPRLPRIARLVDEAQMSGIGVCTLSENTPQKIRAARMPLPRSYASWLFNEWVCGTAYR